jgi:Inner membrane component of T3SS, cytoplasmic domain
MTAAAQRNVVGAASDSATAALSLAAAPARTDPTQIARQTPEAPSPPVLRILSGPHTGAESELTSERLLIGNLDSECDIVIDVSRPERHICLVRVSTDGWTVLGIAGDLWVDRTFVEPQHTHDITSGMVVTLGRVAFCIADSAAIDWSGVKPVLELVRPDPTGPLPTTALPPSPEVKLRKWHALKLAAGIGIASLTVASAGAYLTAALATKMPTAQEAAAKLKADQAMVSALPFGKELQLKPEPTSANRVHVHGYLPKLEQAAALERALREASLEAEFHVTAIDHLSRDVQRRFDQVKSDAIRYENTGRFSVQSESSLIDVHDRQARQTLQELPALSGLNLSIGDLKAADGQPIVVRYDRSADRPGDILVSELDVIRQRQRIVVRERRTGAMPSIVLDNGARYFEGAVLPDKSVLKRVEATQLIVSQGSGERLIPLTVDSPASSLR